MNQYRKLVTALAGAAALAVSQGLIVGTSAKWVGVGIAFLTAAGVYVASNDVAVDEG